MTRHLLTSASALALLATATPAFSQANNTRDITTAGGTGNTATCTNNATAGDNNNPCPITQRAGDNNIRTITQRGDSNRALNEQTGSNNGSNIDQTGPTSGTDTSTGSTTVATGAGNSATVLQTSAFPTTTDAAFRANTSSVTQSGVRNVAGVTQSNTSTSATVNNQNNVTAGTTAGGNTSNGNESSVTQLSTSAPTNSTSVANSGNFVRVDQGTGNNRLGQSSTISQNGGLQSATVNQLFSGNFSRVNQGAAIVAGATTADASSGNRAAIAQNGQGGTSTVTQTENNNTANVTLGTGATNAAGGAATIGASSSITQSQSGNTATVFITGGGQTANSAAPGGGPNTRAGAPAAGTQSQNNNQSTIIQRNTTVGVFAAPATAPSNGTATDAERANIRNDAFVSLTRGQQQSSSVTQDGIQNFADVTVTSGVAGFDQGSTATTGGQTNDPSRGLSGGNTSSINQTGRGNSAVVTIGSDRSTTAPQGFGNSVSITQTATRQFQGRGETTQSRNFVSEGRFAVTEPTLGAAGQARGIFVQTYQTGRFGSVTINQSDTTVAAGGPTNNADGTVSRARADVAQSGERHNLSLTQVGDNFASLTQGQIGIGANNALTVNQTDAGEGSGAVSTSGSGVDEFGNPTGGGSSPNTTARAFNVAVVTQYGSNNTMTIDQNTRNGFVSAFQATNTSGNVIDIDQLAAGSATGAADDVAASRGNTANVSQFANNNAADVDQTGSRNVATVEQRGVGAAAATLTPNTTPTTATAAGVANAFGNEGSGNLVVVQQSGNDNRGRVVQGAGVGRSASFDDGTAATRTEARNAEARLIQTGNSNSGTIEQNGRGQRAEIRQSGNNNTAGILQEATAVNAFARIEQSGSRNTFFIRQNAVNQSFTVVQNGNDNAATTRDPATGNSGGLGGLTPQ